LNPARRRSYEDGTHHDTPEEKALKWLQGTPKDKGRQKDLQTPPCKGLQRTWEVSPFEIQQNAHVTSQ